jgi:hypothetical protein
LTNGSVEVFDAMVEKYEAWRSCGTLDTSAQRRNDDRRVFNVGFQDGAIETPGHHTSVVARTLKEIMNRCGIPEEEPFPHG